MIPAAAPGHSRRAPLPPLPLGRSAAGSASFSSGAAGDRYQAHADDGEPAPGDLPAPDVLTGTDLIEQELGGRVIQELDGP